MQLPPSSWGPFFWHTIHIVALGYPSNPSYGHKKSAKEFYEAFKFLLPCPICRQHYEEYLQEVAITPFLDRRDDLFRWTVDLHNSVNQKLGKGRVTEQEAISYYKRLGVRGRSPVFTPDDFAEADLRSMIRGIGLGVGITAVVGASVWWVSKGE